ncbi:hypothetical protein [Virgibacillus oceani]|uniref:Uncharacterized protein n=1 Tax=Virgibacillus oceani TaxID=1479511 RepID=A0A917M4N3_9BACI|nr:hypothetical protein [Virgibacillus oceani]GGG76726.1 hypothetical protein GCM10011398_22180 [Virgibacillus oceani]
MKKIHSIKDIKNIIGQLPNDCFEYISQEFHHLYDYLGNGEAKEDFQLETYQSMIIIEEISELERILKDTPELEFTELIQLESNACMRIGIYQVEDIQLHYFFK